MTSISMHMTEKECGKTWGVPETDSKMHAQLVLLQIISPNFLLFFFSSACLHHYIVYVSGILTLSPPLAFSYTGPCCGGGT